MEKLGINLAAGILDIINTILVALSWVIVLMSLGLATNFFYAMLGIGLIVHIVALVMSKKAGISITGHVLGIIGCGIFLVSMAFALPSFVILIIAAVFTLKQSPAKI